MNKRTLKIAYGVLFLIPATIYHALLLIVALISAAVKLVAKNSNIAKHRNVSFVAKSYKDFFVRHFG